MQKFITESNLKSIQKTIQAKEAMAAYITGFTEADGCFTMMLVDSKGKLRIIPVFYLTQDEKSYHALSLIQEFFKNLGSLNYSARDKTYTYKIHGVAGCSQILDHFSTTPLYGEKLRNFVIFRFLVNYLKQGKHQTSSGMKTAIELIYLIHSQGSRRKPKELLFQTYGLETAADFSVISTVTSLVKDSEIKRCTLDHVPSAYIAGLFDGDGTFNITFKSSLKIQLTMAVGMCKDSINLLQYLQHLFGAGNVYRVNDRFFRYQVQNLRDIQDRVLPHFNENSLKTHKKEHYKVFVEILHLCLSRERQKKDKQ